MNNELVISHMPLAEMLGAKCSGIPIDDAKQEAIVGLIYAAEKYEPGRGVKFSTFAYNVIRNHLLNSVVAYMPSYRSQPAPMSESNQEWNENERQAILNALSRLAPDMRLALEMRYGDREASFEKIGAVLGCSHTHARAVVAAGIVKLKELYEWRQTNDLAHIFLQSK